MKKIGKRSVIRLTSYALALVLVLTGLAAVNYYEAKQYRWQLEANYQHYFGELVSGIDKISFTLQKGQYAKSRTMASALSNEVARQSALAAAALSSLPFANIELEKTAKFLSQVGDYSYSLSKKSEITEDDLNNITQLANTAYQLSSSLSELYHQVLTADSSITSIADAENTASAKQLNLNSVSDTLNEIETQFPEYAGLIYDGPFSEHINKLEAVYLKDKPEVTMEYAKEHAAKVFGIDPDMLSFDGESSGSIPVYSFSAETDHGTLYVDITKQGGYVIDMMTSGVVSDAKLTPEECITLAKEFMSTLDITNMDESYYISQENIVTVNFAWDTNGITCYPDLVKVSIAQDTGRISGFESRGYLMSHSDNRALPEIKVSAAEAEQALADGLTVENSGLAIIPSDGKYELLCHEFKCTDDKGMQYLIYVNVTTGNEEQILILQQNDNGILTV